MSPDLESKRTLIFLINTCDPKNNQNIKCETDSNKIKQFYDSLYIPFFMVTLQPNLNNLNSKSADKSQDFISNTVRIGRFIIKKDEYTQILYDLVKSFYQKNDNYMNFLTGG